MLSKLTSKALLEFCQLAMTSDNSVMQVDLFGNVEIVNNGLIERAKTIADIRSRLSSEKRLFGVTAKNAQKLERGNNKIDQISSKQISDAASVALVAFDALKLQSGKLADLISDYRKAPKETYDAIVNFLSDPQLIFS